MIESEDGTVTGSIDVARLSEIKPKTDEARAQLDVLKAEAQAGQEQAVADAEKLAEQEKAQSVEGQKESQKETTTEAGALPNQEAVQSDDQPSGRKSRSSGKE
jgi:hypothetical protein